MRPSGEPLLSCRGSAQFSRCLYHTSGNSGFAWIHSVLKFTSGEVHTHFPCRYDVNSKGQMSLYLCTTRRELVSVIFVCCFLCANHVASIADLGPWLVQARLQQHRAKIGSL